MGDCANMFLTTDNKMKWNWVVAGAAITLVLAMAGILWFDKPLFLFLRRFDCALWVFLGDVFSAKVWIAVSGIALLVFYGEKCLNSDSYSKKKTPWFNLIHFFRDFVQKTKRSYAFLMFCSVLSAGVVVKVLKTLIGRARPVFFEALDMTGFFAPSTEWAFNSMPSGHAAVSFAGLVMLGLLVPRIKPVTWTLAVIIGFSRVAAGMHWPTDVIVGAFIGMLAADVVKYFISRRN